MHSPIRGYDGNGDLEALGNFIAAAGISDEEIECRVHCAIMALNQELMNAEVAGIRIDIIRGEHIWMDNPVLYMLVHGHQ
jgi:hypothetical protein